MSTEIFLHDMEKGGLQVERDTSRPRHNRCWRWLAATSFAALAGATVVLTLLFFQVIPYPHSTSKQSDWQHQNSPADPHLSPIPQQLKLQAMESQKPAAHLIADLSHKSLRWISDRGNAFMENGMMLEDNTLVIPARGLYFVYTQVVYYGGQCPAKGSLYLVHSVYKRSESYSVDMPLLSATKSACEGTSPNGQHWYESIYQGAVFSLEEGDVLSTRTTQIANLDPKGAQNYFGVIAM
ncbi:tumor necrosis factor-like [Ambystoma mexicanum]|uniref:tumor necrosis factor-like n=1 Tax=Ambystoma mexicanum TaxID=8296 RepID=UPI0037E8A60A